MVLFRTLSGVEWMIIHFAKRAYCCTHWISGVAKVGPIGPRPYQSRRRNYVTPNSLGAIYTLFCASLYLR